MVDTLPNIRLPANEWTDLYSSLSISLGTEIVIQNIGMCDIQLTASAGIPSDEDAIQIVQRGDWVKNNSNDLGAWAFCSSTGALMNVRIA